MTTAIFNIDKTIGPHVFLQEDALVYSREDIYRDVNGTPLFVCLMLRRINRWQNTKKQQQVEEEKARKNGTRLVARRCTEREQQVGCYDTRISPFHICRNSR
jgi:hypothetical protein